MEKTITFSEYLISQFQNHYQGGDDGGPDAEAEFFSNISNEDLIEKYIDFLGEKGLIVGGYATEDIKEIVNFIVSQM